MTTPRLLGLGVLALLPILVAACDGGSGDLNEPTAASTATAERPTPTATILSEATSEPTPTGASQLQLRIEDAPTYLEVGDVLPGFHIVAVGRSPAAPKNFSDTVTYQTEDELQSVVIFMSVDDDASEIADLRASYSDVGQLEESLLRPLLEGTEELGVEASVSWSDAAVGDVGKSALVTFTDSSGRTQLFNEVISFLQQVGPTAAVVVVTTVWIPEGPHTIETISVAQAISDNLQRP